MDLENKTLEREREREREGGEERNRCSLVNDPENKTSERETHTEALLDIENCRRRLAPKKKPFQLHMAIQ